MREHRVDGQRRRASRGCRSCCWRTAPTLVAPVARGAGGEDRPADRADASVLRPRHRRRGPGRSRLRGLRRVGGTEGGPDRAERAGRPGRHELDDRELPRVSRAASPARISRGARPRRPSVRHRDPGRPFGHRPATRGSVQSRAAVQRRRKSRAMALMLSTGHGGPRARRAWRRRSSSAPASTTARRCRKPRCIAGSTCCVLGGANSAGQGALFFARYAEHGHDHRPQADAVAGDVALSGGPHQRRRQHHRHRQLGDRGRARQQRTSSASTCAMPRRGETQTLDGQRAVHLHRRRAADRRVRPLVATDEQGFILTGADARAGRAGASSATR